MTIEWSNFEVCWESSMATLNRFFDSKARAQEYAQHLLKNPAIIRVVLLEHDGPHGRSPSIKTVFRGD